MGAPSDSNLVAAIERSYRDCYPRFLRLAVAMLGDVDRGRDAVQEAFARALRSRGALHRVENLDGWLWRTLVNVCRVDQRHPLDRLDETQEFAENDHAGDWPEIRAAIAALPERQRLVLFLRHYADLDYRQIGEAAGIERGTVAATLNAAHAGVREAMKEVHR
jgi:RNA polymerase sigma factor (sigma-70 family)